MFILFRTMENLWKTKPLNKILFTSSLRRDTQVVTLNPLFLQIILHGAMVQKKNSVLSFLLGQLPMKQLGLNFQDE